MSAKGKATRHGKLYKTVTTHTSHTWAVVLVKMLPVGCRQCQALLENDLAHKRPIEGERLPVLLPNSWNFIFAERFPNLIRRPLVA